MVPVPAEKADEFGHHGDQVFATTRWSWVLSVRDEGARRRESLEALCRAYWLPVYGYLRRRGHAPAAAEDLTQGFFMRLLETDFFAQPDPERGSFRGYLIGALKRFLADEHERATALKRGGGVPLISWEDEDAERRLAEMDDPQLDPAEAYEVNWATTLLARALRDLEEEQRAAGREQMFTLLKPFLSAPPTRGEYTEAASALGTTRTHVAVQVHRLTQRFAELVRLEVQETVADPGDVKAEMDHLARVLRR